MNVDFAKGKDIVSISTVNSKGELIKTEILGKASLNIVRDKEKPPVEGIDFRKGYSGSLSLINKGDLFNVFSSPFNYAKFITEYEEKVLKPYLKHKRRERNRKRLHAKNPKRKNKRGRK